MGKWGSYDEAEPTSAERRMMQREERQLRWGGSRHRVQGKDVCAVMYGDKGGNEIGDTSRKNKNRWILPFTCSSPRVEERTADKSWWMTSVLLHTVTIIGLQQPLHNAFPLSPCAGLHASSYVKSLSSFQHSSGWDDSQMTGRAHSRGDTVVFSWCQNNAPCIAEMYANNRYTLMLHAF